MNLFPVWADLMQVSRGIISTWDNGPKNPAHARGAYENSGRQFSINMDFLQNHGEEIDLERPGSDLSGSLAMAQEELFRVRKASGEVYGSTPEPSEAFAATLADDVPKRIRAAGPAIGAGLILAAVVVGLVLALRTR